MASSDTEDTQFYDALSNDGSENDGMVIDTEDNVSQDTRGCLHYRGDDVQMDDAMPAHDEVSSTQTDRHTHLHYGETSGMESSGNTLDLADSIPGLYRVLDLVHDKGSGGLVDKIIIKQDSLGRLINELCPGAYTSITKVDFATLDSVRVKPIGLYGSKSAIVEFLLEKKVVSKKTASAMLRVTDSPGLTQPYLSSGMYILLRKLGEVIYVIYWPEDTTWNDNCLLSVAKNRVTFMRYLTKIADQVVCLMSDEHAKAMVWRGDALDDDQDSIDDDNNDRLFAFEVSKTNEQEEGVTSRPGFEFQIPLLSNDREANIPLDATALRPRLVRGEMRQGFVTAQYVPEELKLNHVTETHSEARLKNLLQHDAIRFHEDLSAEALSLLVKLGLPHDAGDALRKYNEDVQDVTQSSRDRLTRDLNESVSRIDAEDDHLSASLETTLMAGVLLRFPSLAKKGPRMTDDGHGSKEATPVDDDCIREICSLYPEVASIVRDAHENASLKDVHMDKYKSLKERILTLDHILASDLGLDAKEMGELIVSTLKEGFSGKLPSRGGVPLLSRITGFFTRADSSPLSQTVHIPQDATDTSDEEFLCRLPDIVNCHPQLSDAAAKVVDYALKHFHTVTKRQARDLSSQIRKIQRDTCAERIRRRTRIEEHRQLEGLRLGILRTLNANLQRDSPRKTITIQQFELGDTLYERYGQRGKDYKIIKIEETCTTPQVRYTIYPIELKEEDAHRMHEDNSYIPAPQVHMHSASTFCLPVDTALVYVHLLPKSRCVLVTRDCSGEAMVYVSSTTHLSHALSKRPAKRLKRDKIGENLLLAYDESKRILAVCGMSSAGAEARLELHTFQFDESYASLHGVGTPVVLSSWYETAVTITHMEFVNSEEIVFVDNDSRARVYSLVAQRFRPATLQLQGKPSSVHSTPDGSCLFVVEESEDDISGTTLRAYHWSSFGSSEGININIPNMFIGNCIVTSLLASTNVYLLGLDLPAKALRSLKFTINSRITEFTFKRKGKLLSNRKEQATRHNSLVDCHAEVWTRFPVVPAVRRETVVSALRERRVLAFVSNVDPKPFAPHFSALIDNFSHITRKPTGDELKNIYVLALDHGRFLTEGLIIPSTFRAGEWLVELLCLIPIHIAVTRDNRFVPLKDGVWSADLERSLLGADVPKIIDNISFGWYESLFRSYMATKPIKVVSSMGEQSVGKSFALNHLVDTSFAGSAMRTTEGVWMSVTPTDDVLIVALDFEGVHSIERSAQEDTLLVLFNTAISNLVLFRNNFALSRDITGLFQSFQSSASVLDPEANPMLFQSTLVIVIKDVVDSDKDDITKEFYLKFQQIVQAEQAMNFISRLHRNRLDIVPWPVIESKQFYALFKTIKKRLDQQPITHQGGAVFLQMMKTLMAKLKANDWGAMSQNMAAHRTHLLLSLLPNALAFGAAEVIPDFEALTDFDTGAVIEAEDSGAHFYLGEAGPQGQPTNQDDALQDLCHSWDRHRCRFSYLDADWRSRLQAFLDQTVDARIGHVRAWLHANTAKFGSMHADVQQLFRIFDETIIDIKAGVRLCATQCAVCNLGCILGHRHDGPHSCGTNHRCVHHCLFYGANHGDFEPCGLPAGHPGTHLCDVTAHLCGQSCKLSGRRGCQEACIKPVDHEDEHLCSAMTHECGLACSLSAAGMHLPDGDVFSCIGRCRIPSDILHDEHRCDNLQCPIKCQLCKRLCSERDHLHGLNPDAVHLCGEEHSCNALCKAPGICQIEVAPQSVEATFTGRYESFQYTKYTQESRRLQCAVVIPAGETYHHGDHTHDLGPKPFHFCEERCPDCGYFCTLPLGHTQKEHDTSHGSMSRTQWAIDGPDGTILEVNGRKFGSNDDGAPMLCSLYCCSLGRHVHVDWCRSVVGSENDCGGSDHEHITTCMEPEPNRAKDWVTHALYWRRTGFKDPYSQEDQINFAKCDSMCSGPEHNTQPSYCVLPIFHALPQALELSTQSPANIGYISSHGHQFACPNPVVLGQAFHVIFIIDRSTSMRGSDRLPLENTPASHTIRQTHNNRLGAVFSSLQCFWDARHHSSVTNRGAGRRDAYTVLLFDDGVARAVSNDFTSSPAELLTTVLDYRPRRGTNFTLAIQTAQQCMEEFWSTERAPVIIFLSDGQCRSPDHAMQDVCRHSIALGKPLSFHAVSFGPYSGVLQRMAHIAQDVESHAPQDAVNPQNHVPSAYHEAMDTVRLAETFLGIADSLSKPRGALFRG